MKLVTKNITPVNTTKAGNLCFGQLAFIRNAPSYKEHHGNLAFRVHDYLVHFKSTGQMEFFSLLTVWQEFDVEIVTPGTKFTIEA